MDQSFLRNRFLPIFRKILSGVQGEFKIFFTFQKKKKKCCSQNYITELLYEIEDEIKYKIDYFIFKTKVGAQKGVQLNHLNLGVVSLCFGRPKL